jgi:Domain of unknown function (DUF5668)
MNRYILIRRLTGPAVLLLIGVLALLHQAGVLEHFWHLFWPLLLILIGVLKLAERAALSAEGYPPPYPGAPYAAYGNQPYPGAPAQQPPVSQTSIVPANRNDDIVNGGGL